MRSSHVILLTLAAVLNCDGQWFDSGSLPIEALPTGDYMSYRCVLLLLMMCACDRMLSCPALALAVLPCGNWKVKAATLQVAISAFKSSETLRTMILHHSQVHSTPMRRFVHF